MKFHATPVQMPGGMPPEHTLVPRSHVVGPRPHLHTAAEFK